MCPWPQRNRNKKAYAALWGSLTTITSKYNHHHYRHHPTRLNCGFAHQLAGIKETRNSRPKSFSLQQNKSTFYHQHEGNSITAINNNIPLRHFIKNCDSFLISNENAETKHKFLSLRSPLLFWLWSPLLQPNLTVTTSRATATATVTLPPPPILRATNTTIIP